MDNQDIFIVRNNTSSILNKDYTEKLSENQVDIAPRRTTFLSADSKASKPKNSYYKANLKKIRVKKYKQNHPSNSNSTSRVAEKTKNSATRTSRKYLLLSTVSASAQALYSSAENDEEYSGVSQTIISAVSHKKEKKAKLKRKKQYKQQARQNQDSVYATSSSEKKVVETKSKPLLIAGAIILGVAIIAVLIMPFLALSSTLTLKADLKEINAVWLYVTQLDAQLIEEISSHNMDVNVDGENQNSNNIEIETNPELILAYLDTKYNDYKFEDVESEIKSIHNAIYEVSYNNYMTDPDFEEGHELGSPFSGKNWKAHISSHYGGRYDPISGVYKIHYGVDVAYPIGTPINAVMDGKLYRHPAVKDRSRAIWKSGNWVELISGNKKIICCHMSSFNYLIPNGASVKAGDVIGYIGSTGYSTGPHTHIEYTVGGSHLNPEQYFSCLGKSSGGSSSDASTEINAVQVTTQDLKEHLEKKLSDDEKDLFKSLCEIGILKAIQTYDSPITEDYIKNTKRRYGYYYNNSMKLNSGIIIKGELGKPVFSIMGGTATTGFNSSEGNFIEITSGIETFRFCHLAGFNIESGSEVKAGDVIGYIGSTGDASGSQVYIEYSRYDEDSQSRKKFNPQFVIRSNE